MIISTSLLPYPHVKNSILLRFIICQLYPLLFLQANSIPMKLFNQKAHIRVFVPFVNIYWKWNKYQAKCYRGLQRKEEVSKRKKKIHTNYKYKKILLTLRLDEGQQTKQCYCCFVEVKTPRMMGKGRNTNWRKCRKEYFEQWFIFCFQNRKALFTFSD